jgi:hypothetical protein
MDNIQSSAIEQDMQTVEKESALDKSFGELFNEKNLRKKTDLTRNEIADIAIILTFAKRFGFLWLETLVNNFLELMISKKRKGRTEMVSIAQAELVRQQEVARAYSQMENTKKRG